MTEPVQVVELVVPRCAERFGVAPCTASGRICHNTWGTCGDRAAYDPSGSIAYRFAAKPIPGLVRQVDENTIETDAFAGLVGVSEVPSAINPEGVKQGELALKEAALGTAGGITFSFRDIRWRDHQGDFYAGQRSTSGFFWEMFDRRVPYVETCRVRYYQGVAGQALADMRRRTYLPAELAFDGSGGVSLKCRNPLQVPLLKDAKFPAPAQVALRGGITATSTTISVTAASAAELTKPCGNVATLYLRIGDEIIGYSGVTDLGGGFYALTDVQRGALGATADSHEADDACQRVGRYEGAYAWEIAHDILTNHSPIPSDLIGAVDDWRAQLIVTHYLFKFDGTVEEPLGVFDLLGELVQSSLCTYAWDEDAGLIGPVPVAYRAPSAALDAREKVLRGSERLEVRRREAVSRVVIAYRRRDPTGDFGIANVERVQIGINAEAEDPRSGASPSTVTINSRWMTNRKQASKVAQYLADRFSATDADDFAVPGSTYYEFTTRDLGLTLGDEVTIASPRITDADGAEVVTRWRITRIARAPDGTTSYRSDLSPFRAVVRPGLIAPNDAPSYADASAEERATWLYITDAQGLNPDGTPGNQIS